MPPFNLSTQTPSKSLSPPGLLNNFYYRYFKVLCVRSRQPDAGRMNIAIMASSILSSRVHILRPRPTIRPTRYLFDIDEIKPRKQVVKAKNKYDRYWPIEVLDYDVDADAYWVQWIGYSQVSINEHVHVHDVG